MSISLPNIENTYGKFYHADDVNIFIKIFPEVANRDFSGNQVGSYFYCRAYDFHYSIEREEQKFYEVNNPNPEIRIGNYVMKGSVLFLINEFSLLESPMGYMKEVGADATDYRLRSFKKTKERDLHGYTALDQEFSSSSYVKIKEIFNVRLANMDMFVYLKSDQINRTINEQEGETVLYISRAVPLKSEFRVTTNKFIIGRMDFICGNYPKMLGGIKN